ncbi:hypothetical protein SLE2022_098670 [Rubroshorea leprosula]
MAISKFFVTSLVISLSLLQFAVADETGAKQIDCGAACDVRCSKSSRPNLCKRACGTCCARCNCVPPGTSGNYEACPCYANETTHGGKPKCP